MESLVLDFSNDVVIGFADRHQVVVRVTLVDCGIAPFTAIPLNSVTVSHPIHYDGLIRH